MTEDGRLPLVTHLLNQFCQTLLTQELQSTLMIRMLTKRRTRPATTLYVTTVARMHPQATPWMLAPPADMDGDLTCDALDTERDGDGYDNDMGTFPDDVNEWVDTDSDGTGNNADTDDDGDGTTDVDDVWSLLACASDDFDEAV